MATLPPQLASSLSLDGWAVIGGARARPAIVGAALVTAVGGGLLLATSDHLVKPVAYGLQMGITILGAGLAAAVWLKRRPRNRVAVYLLAYALTVAIVTLQGASNELLHSLGVLIEPAFFLLGYILVFAFPAGRPIGIPERLILAGMSLYFLVGFVPWMFFSAVVQGGGPLAGCTDACPANALMIADRPDIAASLGPDLVVGGDRAPDRDARPARRPAPPGQPSAATHPAAGLRDRALLHGPRARLPRVRRRRAAARRNLRLEPRVDTRGRPRRARVRAAAGDRPGEPVRGHCAQAVDRPDRRVPRRSGPASRRSRRARRRVRRAGVPGRGRQRLRGFGRSAGRFGERARRARDERRRPSRPNGRGDLA